MNQPTPLGGAVVLSEMRKNCKRTQSLRTLEDIAYNTSAIESWQSPSAFVSSGFLTPVANANQQPQNAQSSSSRSGAVPAYFALGEPGHSSPSGNPGNGCRTIDMLGSPTPQQIANPNASWSEAAVADISALTSELSETEGRLEVLNVALVQEATAFAEAEAASAKQKKKAEKNAKGPKSQELHKCSSMAKFMSHSAYPSTVSASVMGLDVKHTTIALSDLQRNEQPERKVLVLVTIEIAAGKSDTIEVAEGDSCSQLAMEFIRKHNLELPKVWQSLTLFLEKTLEASRNPVERGTGHSVGMRQTCSQQPQKSTSIHRGVTKQTKDEAEDKNQPSSRSTQKENKVEIKHLSTAPKADARYLLPRKEGACESSSSPHRPIICSKSKEIAKGSNDVFQRLHQPSRERSRSHSTVRENSVPQQQQFPVIRGLDWKKRTPSGEYPTAGDRLYAQALNQKKKLEAAATAAEEERARSELEGYGFKPTINKNLSVAPRHRDPYGSPPLSRRSSNSSAVVVLSTEEQQVRRECTFRPKISAKTCKNDDPKKKKDTSSHHGNAEKSFSPQLAVYERLHRAQKETEKRLEEKREYLSKIDPDSGRQLFTPRVGQRRNH